MTFRDFMVALFIVGIATVFGGVVWRKAVAIPASLEVVEPEDAGGELVPEDPDRQRDWRIADEQGAM